MNAHSKGILKQPSKLREDQIAAIAAIAHREAGINISAGKLDFLQARLARRVADTNMGSFKSYIALVESDTVERQKFVEAITVHTTSFYREEAQYNWLRASALAEITAERRDVVFWSAACSSGQEGWTSLMVADAYRRVSGRHINLRMIGTDVSTAVVKRAARAIYDEQEIQSIPRDVRMTYLLRSRKGDGQHRIVPELRRSAEWRAGNLATGSGIAGITADVAFLRNVLIYFDAKMQAVVVNRVVNGIRPGGFLLTGHSETGFSHPELVAVQPSIYRKVPVS